MARKVHYWLERLIREDKDSCRERFYNTYTSENDERFKKPHGFREGKPYFALFIRILFIISVILVFILVIYYSTKN